MNKTKIKTYRMWYHILIVIGVVGIMDIVTRSIAQNAYGLSADIGYVMLGIFYPLRFLFGTALAAAIISWVEIILGIWPLWLTLGNYFNKKSNVLENPTEENQKGLKQAKEIMLLVGGIGILLLSMFLS